jgi:hypothetical protein
MSNISTGRYTGEEIGDRTSLGLASEIFSRHHNLWTNTAGEMSRLDIILIGLAFLLSTGGLYFVIQWSGVDSIDAGIWTQVVLVAVILAWLSTYGFRALTKNMTYNQQLKDYEDAFLQKRLDEMSPEELAQLQAEIEQEKQKQEQEQAENS